VVKKQIPEIIPENSYKNPMKKTLRSALRSTIRAFAAILPLCALLAPAVSIGDDEEEPTDTNEVMAARRDAALAAVSRPAPPYNPREFYVNNITGADTNDGLSPAAAVRTLAKAVSLLTTPGDTLHLADTAEPYRETLTLGENFGGVAGHPIIIDGHGATITGADPLRADGWVAAGAGGLYKSTALMDELQETDDAAKIMRVYFIFDGVQQRMGRTSKGSKPAFKTPAELAAGEWTFVETERAFYIKTDASDLAAANIEIPYRRNGVTIRANNAAATHILIKNLICCHVLNDGFNFHGTTRNLRLENIAAYECGDDGISPHESCEMDIDGLWSIGNSTGMANGYITLTTAANIHLENNFACQLMTGHSALTRVTHARIRATDGQLLTQGNPNRDPALAHAQFFLDNVQLSSAAARLIQNYASSELTATRVTSVGPRWFNGSVSSGNRVPGGTVNITHSAIGNTATTIDNIGAWSGTGNIYDHAIAGTGTTPPAGDIAYDIADIAADALTTRTQPFAGAGADPSLFAIPPRPVPNPAAGKFTTLPPADTFPAWAVADNLASWRFTGLAVNTAISADNPAPAVSVADGLAARPLALGAGVTGANPNGFAAYNSGNPTPGARSNCAGTGINRTTETDALANNEYISLTIAPTAGRRLVPAALLFDLQASTLLNNATAYTTTLHAAAYASPAGFTGTAARLGEIATAAITNTPSASNTRTGWRTVAVNLAALPAVTDADSPLEIRLYVWHDGIPGGTSASSWFLEFDNIILRGAVEDTTTPPPPPDFVAVTDITGVPAAATAGAPLVLNATVVPADATNKTINWSIKTDAGTGATITSGTLFTATAAGTATITAAITNGAAPVGQAFGLSRQGEALPHAAPATPADYTKDFYITVAAAPPPPSENIIITFDPNGGSLGAQPATKEVTRGETYGALPVPARANYAFRGWWTTAAGTGAQIVAGDTVPADAAPQTLHAKWEVTGSPDDAAGAAALASNTPQTNISGALDTFRYYKMNVPAGAVSLIITATGGTGDCNLYIKPPAADYYEFVSDEPGNNETITIADPDPGEWSLMLHAYEPYTGVTLTAACTAGAGGNNDTDATGTVRITGGTAAGAPGAFLWPALLAALLVRVARAARPRDGAPRRHP
jgi:hypothetical protein